MEYRFRDVGNAWRYRPEVRVDLPARLDGRPVTPFLAEEGFYDATARVWTTAQTTAGLQTPLGPHWAGQLAYQHQAVRASVDNDVVSVGLTYRVPTRP